MYNVRRTAVGVDVASRTQLLSRCLSVFMIVFMRAEAGTALLQPRGRQGSYLLVPFPSGFGIEGPGIEPAISHSPVGRSTTELSRRA